MTTDVTKAVQAFNDPDGSTLQYKLAWTITPPAIAASAEEHGIEINYTGTMASSSGAVALNIAMTTAGTAGAWACGIFAKVIEGATKNVNGYLNAAEFELQVAATNPSDYCVMALNSIITTSLCSHPAYMYMRDYGTTAMQNLFWFADQAVGTTSKTVLLSSTSDLAASHTIRFLISGTPYWILCNSTGP